MFHQSKAGTLLLIPLSLMLAACNSTTPEEEEPEVETLRIIMGTDTVDIASNGTVTGGPIDLGVGNTAFTVQWLKADGTPESLVTAAEFQLNVDSDNTAVATFSRTSAFAGNLVGVAAGSTTLEFSLFHLAEAHEDFGPHPVSVTVS